VVEALDKVVPHETEFHLFGVKSEALLVLASQFPKRVTSVDSMAWAYAARCASRKTKTACTQKVRATHMGDWYVKQVLSLI
jgi:hypothetical protein